jgi:hypothetical protein
MYVFYPWPSLSRAGSQIYAGRGCIKWWKRRCRCKRGVQDDGSCTSCLGMLLHDYMYMSLGRFLSCDSQHCSGDSQLTSHRVLHLQQQ